MQTHYISLWGDEMKTYQDLKEHSLGMIAFFETSNIILNAMESLQGIGMVQGFHMVFCNIISNRFFATLMESLELIIITNYVEIFLVTDYEKWASMINATLTEQQTWGTEIGDPATGRHSCLQPWKDYFMTLGTSQPSIDKQIELSGSWHTNALKWFNNLGLYSRRGYALMFDISVQMGRFFPQNVCLDRFRKIDPTGKTRAQIEEEKLYIIVELCSNGNNRCFNTQTIPDLQGIVFRRKSAVVDGTSNQGFNINFYDLKYDPAFQGGIISG